MGLDPTNVVACLPRARPDSSGPFFGRANPVRSFTSNGAYRVKSMEKKWLFILGIGLVFVVKGDIIAQKKSAQKATTPKVKSFAISKSSDVLLAKGFALVFKRHLDPKNLDRAEALYKEVLKKDPKNVVALYRLSEACLKRADDLGARGKSKQIKKQAYSK